MCPREPTTAFLILVVILSTTATRASFLALLLPLLAFCRKLRLLFRRQQVVHLGHHPRARHFQLDLSVGPRLRGAAYCRFVECAAVHKAIIATARLPHLLAQCFSALAI